MSDSARALLGFLGLLAGLVSAVLLPAFGARWLLVRFAVSSTWREHAILWTLAALGAIGGFVLFSKATWAWLQWRRGWRVRWIAERRYAYEEFDDRGQSRSIEIQYEPLAAGYAPPCRITVPGADEWNAMTPPWAHGRRDAILERLRLWGSFEGWHAPVTFVSAEPSLDQPRA